MKKAIVIGASSGIGRALSRVLAEKGYEVGLAARRVELMEELRREIRTPTYIKRIDLREPDQARGCLRELIEEMGGVELIVVNSGVGGAELTWEGELEMIAVNVTGFAAMARTGMEYFAERGSGHLVGISSITALKGVTTTYSASKAFDSMYMEGLRLRAHRLGVDVQVTDIKPGFVETPMTAGREGRFWVASAEQAARQIYDAIRKRKRHAYITRRWRLMGWFLKLLPYPVAAWLYRRRKA
jgi:short-subunit dehydrogenase